MPVPDEPGASRPRRFTTRSTDRLGEWAATATAGDFALVQELLLKIAGGESTEGCPRDLDPTHGLQFHFSPRPGLIVTLRFSKDYPDAVQLVYIGGVRDD